MEWLPWERGFQEQILSGNSLTLQTYKSLALRSEGDSRLNLHGCKVTEIECL